MELLLWNSSTTLSIRFPKWLKRSLWKLQGKTGVHQPNPKRKATRAAKTVASSKAPLITFCAGTRTPEMFVLGRNHEAQGIGVTKKPVEPSRAHLLEGEGSNPLRLMLELFLNRNQRVGVVLRAAGSQFVPHKGGMQLGHPGQLPPAFCDQR